MEFRALIGGKTESAEAGQSGVRQADSYRGRACIRLFFAVFLLLAFNVLAEPKAERIDQVKAAFVLNIARFVSWPPESLHQQDNHLLLCLYRGNPLGGAVNSISGKMVSGRMLQIESIQSLAESAACNILLIGEAALQKFDAEAQKEPNRPVLTIADLTDREPRMPQRNVLVTLVRNGSRIGFEINLGKSRQSGLRMSSQLLKLAKIVGDDN